MPYDLICSFAPPHNKSGRRHCSPVNLMLAVQQLHWLLVYYWIQYKLCLLIYSLINATQPTSVTWFSLLLPLHPPSESLVFHILMYVVPRTCMKLWEHALSVSTTVAWNTLPASIRNTADLKLFKWLLDLFF